MIQYEYDAKSNVIHSFPEGVVKTRDVLVYFSNLAKDESILPQSTEKIYFVKMQDMKLRFSDTLQMRSEYNIVKRRRKISRTVFVVNDDFTYGIARMLQTICSEIDHGVEIERQQLNDS